jgi:hypothetical protein
MSYFTTYLFYLFGRLLIVLGLAVVGLGLLFLCGSVGMDGLFAANEPRGQLTCWHCGKQTRAGLKQCTQCGKELQ